MELSQEQMERMELRRQDKLSGAELADFEKQLSGDVDFAREYELFLASVVAQQLTAREDEREKLKIIETRLKREQEENQSARLSKTRRGGRGKLASRWAAAAAVLLLVSFAGYRFGMPGKPDMADLYVQYFDPYENLITKQSVDGDAMLLQAMAAYDAGEYSRASQAFEALPDSVREGDLMRIYRGNAFLETGNLPRSKEILLQVLEGGDQRLRGTAAWYLAMAGLKSDDSAMAREYLTRAADLDPAYKSKVQEILQRLE
jgi:hypothetical protein